jgi:hypothetical protein
MAFTPEQIAKAYVGPQADIYDVFKDQAALQARQDALQAEYKKQELDAERQNYKLRDSAMNSLLAAQKANNLATGSKLDALWNAKNQEITDRAFSPEGMALYQSNPSQWKAEHVTMYHTLGDQMKSVGAGMKKVDELLLKANADRNGALNIPALRTALINTIAFDEEGKPRETFNAEESNIIPFIEGAYDPLTHKEISDKRQRTKLASQYYDRNKLEQLVLDKFKPDMQPKLVDYKKQGIGMTDEYNLPSYYTIKEGSNTPVLDLTTIKTKNGKTYDVATDNIMNTLSKPNMQIALANHEKDLLETSAGQEAYKDLSRDEFDAYVAADFAKKLPKPEKINTGLNQSEAEAWRRAHTGSSKQGESEGNLMNVAKHVMNPELSRGLPITPLQEADVVNPPSGAQGFIKLNNGLQGSKDLKTGRGTPVDIFQDPNTGKSYMVYRPIRTMAGVEYHSDEAKQTGTDLTNRMIEIPNNDLGYYNKVFNVADYKNKPEDFIDKANRNTGANKIAQPSSVNASSSRVSANTSSNDWGTEIANATQSIKGLGKKKATQIPEALKKKVNNPTSQVVTKNNNPNEDDDWINTIFDFENTRGSRLGGQMTDKDVPNFGYNKHSDELIKIKDLGERKKKAIEYFKKEILPQVKHLPLEVRKMAADLIYNGGQDPRTFLIYAAKGLDSIPENITERQKYWGKTKDKKEIDKLWSQNKDLVEKQLNEPDFAEKLYNVRKKYYDLLTDKEAYNNSWIYRLDMFKNKK